MEPMDRTAGTGGPLERPLAAGTRESENSGGIEISFIVVNWNAGKYLPEFLSSLAREAEGVPHEVIVVDNGSTDGSTESLRAYGPPVRLIESGGNVGFARGNNIGIRAGSGRYLCLVNPDVVFHPGSVAAVHMYLERHPEAGVAGPRVYGSDGALQRTCRQLPTLGLTLARAVAIDTTFDPYRTMSGPREVEVMNGCFWLVRRTALEEVGPLDERFFMYSEDIDWCRRFTDAGWKIVCVPEARITHFGGGSSALAPVRFFLEMRRANLQYWTKYHSGFSVRLFVLIELFHQAVRAAAYGVAAALFSGSRAAASLYKRSRSLAAIRWLREGSAELETPVRPEYYEPGRTGPERRPARLVLKRST